MAHYLTNNEKFHIFSKSPVLSSMAVSQAVNKSGHTVSTNDIWVDDIPWFTEVADEADAIARAADARFNDLILWGSDIYKRKGNKTNGASTGTTFAELWEKHTKLTEARAYALGEVTKQTPNSIVTKTVEIKNSADTVVLKYHVGKQIDLLTTANNANVPSTWAARMFFEDDKGREKPVNQFVSPTDKVYAGFPSTGYTTLVYTATAKGNKYGFVSEGEADGDFVNNAFAGIVQFNQSRNSGHYFAASVFEYVGDTLDEAIPSALTNGTESKGLSLTEWKDNDKIYHYLTLSTAEYKDGIGEDPVWVNSEYLVTADQVESFVNLTVGALDTKVDNLHKAGVSYQVLQTLPNPGVNYNGVVALVKDPTFEDDAISGSYFEYLCVASTVGGKTTYSWEKIGTTKADLSSYVRAVVVNDSVAEFSTTYGYSILGAYPERVVYNKMAADYPKDENNKPIYPRGEYGTIQYWQNFTRDDIPNYDSISVGISKAGEIAIGIETATDEVYGLSKMFTSAIPSTPATDDTTINDHKETAVSVKSASEMYNSLASAIASETPSDEFDIPSFDLNYILQSKINESWVEEMVITSSDYALQIPYKETHYGIGDSYFKYDSINTNGFYTISRPISDEEHASGINHKPIATINKTEDGEYDLTSIYNFPDSPYTGLTAIEYENLKYKIKEAFDEILKGQVKIIEDAFNTTGFSYGEEENPYRTKIGNDESAITQYFNNFISPYIPMYINISTYKDKLNAIDENHKNFIIKITTPEEDVFSINDIIINSESLGITLSPVAENALKEYIYKESSKYSSKYSSTENELNPWVNFLSKVGREAAYKAKWIEDAKNDTIKTPLAFQYQRETTYDLFRLILIKLLGEEQYGKEHSLSKKYMKPGITFTCLTRPYNRIGDTVSQYYSYTQNRWKGNPTGNYHQEVVTYRTGDIKWDYIPSLHTLNNTETWGTVDSFAHPSHWDTTTNEQKFECLADEIERNTDGIDDLTNRINGFENSLTTLNDSLTALNNSITNVKQNPIVLQQGTGISITPSTTTDGTKQYTIACTYEFDTDWFTVTGTKVAINEDKLKQVMNAAFADAIDEIEVQVTTTSPIEQVTNGQGKLRMVTATSNLNTHIGDETALIDTSLAAQATTVSETGEVITELVDLNSL